MDLDFDEIDFDRNDLNSFLDFILACANIDEEKLADLEVSRNDLMQELLDGAVEGVVGRVQKESGKRALRCIKILRKEHGDYLKGVELENKAKELMEGLSNEEILRRELLLGLKP